MRTGTAVIKYTGKQILNMAGFHLPTPGRFCPARRHLCDSSVRIHQLYGPNAVGRFFVIDSDGSIRAKGAFDDMVAIERMVRIVVSNPVFDYYKTGSCPAEHQEPTHVSADDFQRVHKRHATGSESHPAE